ncbi:hypothetical protein LPJ53_006059 [Coemansia erecta]|uniref:BLOC-1-related complex subunit 7 n=1 Tax=Coemansia erecta TaxID=147472 RepID=A0A9W8CPR6_9FUNG|nr:hypothetical protein LPJ53_006059 [Coemansia erecta]
MSTSNSTAGMAAAAATQSAATPTAVCEGQADVREHTQGVVGSLGALAQEMSGGSEVREMIGRASRAMATAVDLCVRDTQQSVQGSLATAARLAARVDEANEKWRTLAKTVDIVKVASGEL